MTSESSGERQPINGGERQGGRLVTVEPVIFLYLWAFNWATHVTMQYTGFYTAMTLSGNPDDLVGTCGESDNETNENLVEMLAEEAAFTECFNLINVLPMALVVLFLGSYSDYRGRRLALLLPVLGGTVRALVSFLVVQLGVSIDYMYFGAGLEGITGGFALMATGLFAYIADISSRTRRSWRMLVLLASGLAGLYLSKVTLGYLTQGAGYANSFVAVLVLFIVTSIVILCTVQETVRTREWPCCLSCSHFLRTLRPLWAGANVTVFRLATLVVFLAYFSVVGLWNIGLYLYVGAAPFCFSWQLVGILVGISAAANFLLGLPAFWCLQPRLRDGGMIILCCVNALVVQMYLAIPVYFETYVFIAPVIGFLAFIIAPLGRAIMSLAVTDEEHGASQALASFLLAICTLAAFQAGCDIFPLIPGYTNILFFLAALVSMAMLAFATCLQYRLRKGAYDEMYNLSQV